MNLAASARVVSPSRDSSASRRSIFVVVASRDELFAAARARDGRRVVAVARVRATLARARIARVARRFVVVGPRRRRVVVTIARVESPRRRLVGGRRRACERDARERSARGDADARDARGRERSRRIMGITGYNKYLQREFNGAFLRGGSTNGSRSGTITCTWT